MNINRASKLTIAMALCALMIAGFSACGGGGGTAAPKVDSINISPGTPQAGTVVTLSAAISNPGNAGAGALTKAWTVSGGQLFLTPPDFSLVLRGTAKAAKATSLSTTQASVYWVVPVTPGAVTVSCAVDQSSKSMDITLGASPVTLSVSDGSNGAKICTIAAQGVSDLYQAAFRVNFSASAWQPTTADPGTFLGPEGEILFFDLENQSGFVPIAITRKGNAAGKDGSGTLATITFAPLAGSSSVSRAAAEAGQPFDLGLVILRNSQDQPID